MRRQLRQRYHRRVAFEQDLRVYLERLLGESPAEAVLPLRQIDEQELQRHFLTRLRELENAGDPDAVKTLFDRWRGKLARFARYLEMLPRQLAPVDRQDAIAFACRVLDEATNCLDSAVPLVDQLELRRLVREFAASDTDVDVYALENQLVRAEHARPARLTGLGRVFLRLRGKDAVRWLLTVEVFQSSGPIDIWRASHDLLAQAMTARGITKPLSYDGSCGYSDEAVKRLIDLGVLVAGFVDSYEVIYKCSASAMRDVVQAVLDPGPWHTAVRALLDDELSMVLTGSSASATEATVEQTKLIAHEVRNALIPVRHDIEALRSVAMEPAQKQRIDAAKQGVVRVLDFVDAMVQMSELITEPLTRCEIGAVVDEALGWIDTGRRVERLPFPDTVHLLAPRARLARAISNVVGNALQATTMDQRVRVSIIRTTGVVRVAIDDGGPGVPIEHRARVFMEGVTMRQDGSGSGFGLAFAQRVVEGALHGKVWCEDSDRGGARFVIELPEASE